jgi:putative ABC transport system permease protein
MKRFNKIRLRFRAFFVKQDLDARMNDEMRSHIEMQTQENIDAGMSPEEARVTAMRQFGRIESIKHVCREQRGIGWFESIARDVRFGARMLFKYPGFTAVAVLTLALGIGANTALFTVAYGVLLKPLPLPHSEQLASVWERGPGGRFGKVAASAQNYLDWKERAKSFAALTCWQPSPLNVGADIGTPERWNGAAVHKDFFKVAGVNPEIGKSFSLEHFSHGADAVVIISYGVWQERFAGDSNVIGKTIQLNGRARTILGVMPAGFKTPAQSRAWVPKVFSEEELYDRGSKSFYVLGRIGGDATIAQANGEIGAIAASLSHDFPAALDGWSAFAHSALEDSAQPMRLPLLVLLASVCVVLLMACVNVANLLLARSAGRVGEMALRTALGAERRHLVRQLGVESLMLAILGGAIGWMFAAVLLKLVIASAPAGLPRVNQVTLDFTALSFTLGGTLLTSFIFGFAPAWQLSQVQPMEAIRDSAEHTTAKAGRVSKPLVVFQIAAAMMVLVATGLLLRSFELLLRTDLGFRPDELLTVRLELPRSKYHGNGRRNQFAQSLQEKLVAVPGVESVAASSQLPFQGWPQLIMRVEGRPSPRQSDAPATGWCGVTPDYFRTLNIAMVRGRAFTPDDREDALRVGVIDETFSRRFFPGEDPLGRRIEVGFSEPPRWIEIVGIARDARNQSVEELPQAEVYVPLAQQDEIFGTDISVAIRTRPGASDIVGALRRAVWSIDKDQPLHNLKPMTQLLADSMAQRRFTLILLSVFAGFALLLTLVGLYGVLACSVSRRRREIGIRIALGAQRGRVMQLVLGEGLRLAIIGIVAGLFGALAVVRVMRDLLYGVSPTDPATFIAMALLLGVVALLACWIPARRAARVDPMTALRSQ